MHVVTVAACNKHYVMTLLNLSLGLPNNYVHYVIEHGVGVDYQCCPCDNCMELPARLPIMAGDTPDFSKRLPRIFHITKLPR